jgi:hypothetical protein
MILTMLFVAGPTMHKEEGSQMVIRMTRKA